MNAESGQVLDIPPRSFTREDEVEHVGAPPSGDTVDSGHVISEEIWRYSMERECKGLFVIFNQENFETQGLPKRFGTEKDKQDMKKVWQNLGFRVKIHNDLKHDEILEQIESYSLKTNHSEYDCFSCAVLTHGEKDQLLWANDETYPIQELLEPFRNCESLVGKPKLFFIQACRGEELDHGNKFYDTTDSNGMAGDDIDGPKLVELKIPSEADFLIAYSTVSGYYSWRNKDGSWFIQTLSNCLEAYASKHDLMTILTAVNRGVSRKESSTNLTKSHRKKQCPSVVSRLTGLVYLKTGLPDDTDAPKQASVSDPQLMSTQTVPDVGCEEQWKNDEYYSLKLELLKKQEEMIRLKKNLYKMKLRKPKFQV